MNMLSYVKNPTQKWDYLTAKPPDIQ
jgi:hypothetical protein